MALPPCFRMSTPAWLASGWAETTIACVAVTVPARSVHVGGMMRVPRMTAPGGGPAAAIGVGREEGLVPAQAIAVAATDSASIFRIRNLIV